MRSKRNLRKPFTQSSLCHELYDCQRGTGKLSALLSIINAILCSKWYYIIKQTVKLKLTLYEYLFEKGLFAIIFFNVFTERDKY